MYTYVYMYTYIYIYIYVYICTYVYLDLAVPYKPDTFMNDVLYIHPAPGTWASSTHTWTQTDTWTHTHAHKHIWIYTYTQCAGTFLDGGTHTHTHKHTHRVCLSRKFLPRFPSQIEWRHICHSIWATHCNTMPHTAIYCNTLQHNATHCNTVVSDVTFVTSGEWRHIWKCVVTFENETSHLKMWRYIWKCDVTHPEWRWVTSHLSLFSVTQNVTRRICHMSGKNVTLSYTNFFF